MGATLLPKTVSLTPTWAPQKIRDCFNKFWGVVPVHGVFEGVALWGQLLFLFHLTGNEICFTDRGQHFEFLPHFEDMASQTLPIFSKNFAKYSRRPGMK